MISSLKSWMFRKSIKEHRNFKSKSSFSGVNHCKKVCILGDGLNERSKKAIIAYASSFEKMNKTVDCLFYYDSKIEEEDGFSKQHLKWSGIPKSEVLDAHLEKQYDLFIYACPTLEKHLEYFTLLCNAKIKMGPLFHDKEDLFDVFIEIKDYSDTALFLKNIDNQLRIMST